MTTVARTLSIMLAAIVAALVLATQAFAMSPSELQERLDASVRGDRRGTCVVAAVIEGQNVQRLRSCAGTRADAGPGFDEAFEIGSISKTMTAFLVADLIEAGRWTLDDPVAKHLPPGTKVPQRGGKQILVKHLLTHTSGLPRDVPALLAQRGADEASLLALLGETPLASDIGLKTSYSNFGVMVLSVAVARAYQDTTGGSLEAAMKARLFDPLNMSGAYISQPPKGTRAAIGHFSSRDIAPAMSLPKGLQNGAGVGMVKARLDDMVRYAQAEMGVTPTPLLSRMRLTQQPVAHGNGMAWFIDRQGYHRVSHGGSTAGFSSMLIMEPDSQRAVVLLSDTQVVSGMEDWALSLLDRSRPVPKPRLDAPFPDKLRQALVGNYTVMGQPVKVWLDGARVLSQLPGQPIVEMRYDDEDTVYPTSGPSGEAQLKVEGGVVTRFSWFAGGTPVEGVRVKP
jgi:D-alanyl-D-alanine-carboxypeptidase/D-alanyl-D-alanine-endopeptidase